jgi:stage II sporulation protein P
MKSTVEKQSKLSVLLTAAVFLGGIVLAATGMGRQGLEKAELFSVFFTFPDGVKSLFLQPDETQKAEETVGTSETVTTSQIPDGSGIIKSVSQNKETEQQHPKDSEDKKTVSETDTSEELNPDEENPVVQTAVTGTGKVIDKHFSSGSPQINIQFGSGFIKNVTDLSDSEVLAYASKEPEYNILKNGLPQVLIYHTHTTETFLTDDGSSYSLPYTGRSSDPSVNMVRVGDEIIKQLEATGIGVIHDTTIHDFQYHNSYARSYETVSAYLKEYPSIEIALDIHRDAIAQSDTTIIKPTIMIDGQKAAQIMIISGCDNGSMNMSNWPYNLRLAARLQDRMESMFPGLTRPILFDYRGYNQMLTNGSLLIEIGGHANTLDEAIYSGELFGKALADYLSEIAH